MIKFLWNHLLNGSQWENLPCQTEAKNRKFKNQLIISTEASTRKRDNFSEHFIFIYLPASSPF